LPWWRYLMPAGRCASVGSSPTSKMLIKDAAASCTQAVDSITVAITPGTFASGYIIYKGHCDQHCADNTSKAAGGASPSRDKLSYRGQWFTLVVKNVRVIPSRDKRTSWTLFNFLALSHSHNMPNIAIWSSLLLLPHSLF
jgi:hypothetical protein